ncbi:GNAT family N-acetyltransferase [Aestuariirhabdus sp. Z084]|uniref:GNAT family N-acetyltransferase n=1 Tax=Aestuariirhabdus haliotis TaxID=2918751 RepID=UPI00201B3C7B|nr:GNAT family N-acetyltransferase [Aestuariirhabdus haliotis]MCL6415025.1 GNAT family N-acetyltransferase [Aestuariirhabdus haliotis]MCL6418957.1 GNAT family N-acetyltransferase [Aestuariirhabdus haliotis]
MANQLQIRYAQPVDNARLLQLMRQLAEFEGYLEQFAVTGPELQQRLFDRQEFSVLVAQADDQLAGMLVYYHIPFTYDLTPWIQLKELYVVDAYRSKGVGRALMRRLARECAHEGGKKIRWDVLAANEKAKGFYRSLGARPETEWELFSMTDKVMAELAGINIRG